MVTHVLMAGRGEDMQPAEAEHEGETVRFGAYLRDGRAAIVITPRLKPAEAARWVSDRMARFKRYDSSRESAEDAIRRKAIAAQGRAFVMLLRAQLDKHGRMELKMMLSPDSHAQGADLASVRRAHPVEIRVARNGVVTGLPDPSVRDNLGRHLVPSRQT